MEISSDDDGFRGAWFQGTVIRPVTTRGTSSKKILVEYKTLASDGDPKKPLRETLDPVQLRPAPPRERERKFTVSDEVDALYSDGWWEGVVTERVAEDRYAVFFRGTKEQIEFGSGDLRMHREWVGGKWVPPVEEDGEGDDQNRGLTEVSTVNEMNSQMKQTKIDFREEMLVEVSSDEDGFQGAWFAATIIKKIKGDKYLIEYKSLRNDDDTDFLREEADTLHIRPYPPDTIMVDRFNLHEEVDALYQDGWWVGVVTKVLNDGRYVVYFRGTNEEMKFNHSDLRIHHEWINDKWVIFSRV